MNIKKFLIGSVAGALMFGAFVVPALADSVPTINFEPNVYHTGNIDGQNGWMKTGPYDVEVATVSSFPNAAGFGFGTQALRLGNSVTSGSFGDQTFAPSLTQPAGESVTNKHFEASFDIGSTQANQQPELFLSVSPDDGHGSRMSYVGFDDQSDGIHVIFYDATDSAIGNVANFNESDVATISRTSAHNIKFSIDFVPGPGNDVVKLYVDGTLVHTGTTWEDYYRFDPEQAGNGNVVPTTSTLLFREGGTAAPAIAGNGYLVDNVSLSSSTPVVAHGEITSPTANEHVTKTLNLAATYDDGDVPNRDDGVQWAVRQGTCAAGTSTVLGNVDGHHDVANWDGNNFSFSVDVRDANVFPPGAYCFVFNPTDDPDQPNVRETQNFFIDAYVPTAKAQCKKGGWEDFVTPAFKNQGQCTSYVEHHDGKGADDIHTHGNLSFNFGYLHNFFSNFHWYN